MGDNNQRGERRQQLEQLAARSESAMVNKTAVLALTILCSIMAVTYVVQLIQGSRSIGYVILMAVLCIVPFSAGWVVYGRDKESQLIRHIVALGFALMYMVGLFTANNDLFFVYAIPMLIIVTLYGDLRYTRLIGIGVAVVDLLSVGIRIVRGGLDEPQITSIQIQIIVVLLIVVYFVCLLSSEHIFVILHENH